MELSRDTISQDETTRLTVTIEGGLKQAAPEIPLPAGLDIRATSRQNLVLNLRRETRIVYEIGAEKPGTYRIGPFQLDMEDGKQTLQAVRLTVTEPREADSDGDLFVTLDTSADTAYVRQTLEVYLTFYSKHPIEDISLVDFVTEGFEVGDWREVRVRDRALNGTRYRVSRYVSRLTPVKEGDYTLNPSFRVQVAEPTDLRRDSGFGMLTRRYRVRTVRLRLKEPVTLTVKTPPAEGRPASYDGNIGRFQLQASVSPREVQVGDPLTLRVRLTGTGSLKEALPPELAGGPDFKVYESRLVEEDLQRGGLSGRKVLEQVLIPLHDGVSRVPELEFSYFDPDREIYQVVRAGPFPINVTGDTAPDGTASLITSIGDDTPTTPTLVGEDLLYLKTRPGRLAPLSARAPGPGFAATAATPFVLYGLVIAGTAMHSGRTRDNAEGRRRRAPRRLRAGLKTLDGLREPAELAGGIWTVLSDYLRNRLDLPPGDVDPVTVATRLEGRLPESTREEVAGWLRDCERARFGGPASETDPDTLRDRFQAFVLRLDRELRA